MVCFGWSGRQLMVNLVNTNYTVLYNCFSLYTCTTDLVPCSFLIPCVHSTGCCSFRSQNMNEEQTYTFTLPLKFLKDKIQLFSDLSWILMSTGITVCVLIHLPSHRCSLFIKCRSQMTVPSFCVSPVGRSPPKWLTRRVR